MNLVFIFVIFFLAHISVQKVFAVSGDIIKDPIEQAIFAESLKSEQVQDSNQQKLGVLVEGVNGMGIVYSRQMQSRRTAWSKISYASSHPVFLKDYAPTSDVANVEVKENKRFQLILGLDQIFHLTQNKYWGVVLGVGVGVNYSEYSSTYYPQLCTFFCGYDPNRPTEKNDTDFYSFLSGTIGVAFFETQVLGLKGDFKIALNPIIGRTGEFYFSSPSGRQFEALNTVPYSFEVAVRF